MGRRALAVRIASLGPMALALVEHQSILGRNDIRLSNERLAEIASSMARVLLKLMRQV